MRLAGLFKAVAGVFDGSLEIENHAREALLATAEEAVYDGPHTTLPEAFLAAMAASGAHPACAEVAKARLLWAPPETSDDPDYVEHSRPKVHVELIGPDGIVAHNRVRLGLYGMLPHAEYGLRTHPAEEVFVMMAGRAWWKRGDADYAPEGPGGRSYHPSMLPHANKTEDQVFMSAYIWFGDVARDGYVYQGIPG